MAERPPLRTTTPGCYFTMDYVPQVQSHKPSISASTASSSVSTSGTTSSSASTSSFSMASDSTPSTPMSTISQSTTTTAMKRTYAYKQPQVDSNGQPLDVLSRHYPKPLEELSVEEALALAPLPGTFRYSAQRAVAEKVSNPEERRAEFERIKQELRSDFLSAKKK